MNRSDVSDADDRDEDDFEGDPHPSELPEIDAMDLLKGKSEIYLVLDGVRYRLRRTRRNKLILQK